MTRYVALLRGVNVGGINLKMADIAGALTDAGFVGGRTVLASGNVLLESATGAATVRTITETTLRNGSATRRGCWTNYCPDRCPVESNPMSRAKAKEKVALTGVSETALLTLNGRAREARHADAIIDDPMAIKLADSIDFDFAKFGPTRQDFALRALAFDEQTRRYLQDHPQATIVALAEGLQTSFWRVDEAVPDGRFRWLTVDLPPIVDIRQRLLPAAPRVSVCAQSALDYSWMDRVDPTDGVFVTAEGLLMYLQPEQAIGLIRECANRFPGGQLLFDLPPAWFATLTRRGLRTSLRYKAPPMPFSLSIAEAANLVKTVPGIRAVRDVQLPAGRGLMFNAVLSSVYRFRLFDHLRPTLTLLEFG